MHKTYRGGWHYDSKTSVLRLEGTQMSGAFVDYEVDLASLPQQRRDSGSGRASG